MIGTSIFAQLLLGQHNSVFKILLHLKCVLCFLKKHFSLEVGKAHPFLEHLLFKILITNGNERIDSALPIEKSFVTVELKLVKKLQTLAYNNLIYML